MELNLDQTKCWLKYLIFIKNKKLRILFPVLLLAVFIVSTSWHNKEIINTNKIYGINNTSKAKTKDYKEVSCLYDRKTIGTLCNLAVGSCKKERVCRKVATVTGVLTEVEIDFYARQYMNYMIDNDYIDAEDSTATRELAIEVLTANQP